jgi:formate/nitrite transporter FocA (FNT family)
MTPPGKDAGSDPAEPLRRLHDMRRIEADAEERRSPSSRIVYNAILKEGEEEMRRRSDMLFWSGLAAGLSMGFSLIAEGLLRTYVPDASWAPLITKLGYSMGFVVVILGRQQLYTENTLTAVLPVLRHRSIAALGQMMRLWGVVLAANLAGALAVATLLTRADVFPPEVVERFVMTSREAMEPGFRDILLRGIVAGWLIALIVWMLPFAEASRLWVIILITYLIGLGGLSHVIAGSVEAFVLPLAAEGSWWHALSHYTLPALIGNTIGGVTLVAALNHAQVAPDVE